MLMSLRFGRALTAKKVSARCWSEVEAVPKQNPVTTPEGSTAASKLKPSYQPRLFDQPMSAYPASHPVPRRLASRAGIAELSNASTFRSIQLLPLLKQRSHGYPQCIGQ